MSLPPRPPLKLRPPPPARALRPVADLVPAWVVKLSPILTMAAVFLVAAHAFLARTQLDPIARLLLSIPGVILLGEGYRYAKNPGDRELPANVIGLVYYYVAFSFPAFFEMIFYDMRGPVAFSERAYSLGSAAVAMGGLFLYGGMRAGELLGARQSGSIAAVGFELYTKMLEEAVAELRGQPIARPLDPDLTCDLPAFIPDDYLPDTGQRLDFYRRLSGAEDEEQIAEVQSEIKDRYGTPPEEVNLLAGLMVVKALARRLCASSVELSESRLALSLRSETPLSPQLVAKLVSVPKSPWRISPDQRLMRVWQGDKERSDRLNLAKSLLADLLLKSA